MVSSLWRRLSFCKFRENIPYATNFCTCRKLNGNRRSVRDSDCRLLFLGSDDFSLVCLRVIQEIVHSDSNISVVVSNQDNRVGKYAKKFSLTTYHWDEFKRTKYTEGYDIGVVASFGHLIPKKVIESCKLGILNVHGSLLPKLRGAAPIARAICNGDAETGISIMKIAPHKFDVGPVLLRRSCKIHPHIRSPELTRIMAQVGALALQEVLLNLHDYMLAGDVQSNEEATFAPKLTPEMSQVQWDSMSANQVYNLYRGLKGFFTLYTHFLGSTIQLDEFGLVFKGESDEYASVGGKKSNKESISEDTDFTNYYPSPVIAYLRPASKIWSESFEPGRVLVHKDLILVCCMDKTWIFCRKVKVKNKWMTAQDFRNGYLTKTKEPYLFLFVKDYKCDLHNKESEKSQSKSALLGSK